MMKTLMELIRLESIHDMIQTNLLQQVIIKSWYTDATEKKATQLEYSRDINGVTWPVVPRSQRSGTTPDDFPPNCSPLLGYSTSVSPINASSCRITCLPKSYTDLYAQLSALCPESDQIALCLICGSVLNAGKSSTWPFLHSWLSFTLSHTLLFILLQEVRVYARSMPQNVLVGSVSSFWSKNVLD